MCACECPVTLSCTSTTPCCCCQGFKLPFDRHDWVVDRCGQDVRYIIDFYSGAPQPGVPASMHLDVRPALDSLGALVDRLRMQARWVASGQWQYE